MTNPASTDERSRDLPEGALHQTVAELQTRLAEAEETLRAIRSGAVDAITVTTPAGDQVFCLKGAEQPYREMIEAMGEGAVSLSPCGTVLYCNRRFADMVQADLRAVIGTGLPAYFAEQDGARIAAALRGSQAGSRLRADLLTGDGTTVPVNIAMHTRSDAGAGAASVVVVSDLTEIAAAEQASARSSRRLEQANRALRVLNACNAIIIHATDERQLLTDTCRALSEVGGYRLAWVGYAEHDEARSVRPVAWADGAGGYVEAVHATWGNDERGLGPTGSAIRTGRMTVMRDADATFRPWRELARREGFRSVGAVPLHVGDAIFGALVIHAGERNGFDEAESALLMELADDVSYCMTNLRRTEKLAETGAYLSNILQSSTKYSIIGKDLERRIVSWNEGARRNYGYDAEAVIDRDSRFLHTPEDLASGSVDRLFATADATGIAEAEFERVRRDGTRFPATVVLTRRNDTEGRPIGYLLISSDITGKRRAEEEKLRAAAHYVRSLIEASLDPLVTIDADGRITDVNKATETVTGLPRDQLIGHDFSGYFTDPEKARDGYRTAFAAGAVTNYPLAIRHISGRVTDVNYNASTYCDDKGRVIGVFAAARDVTYRKQAEAELAMYQRHLEDLVAARTADLAEANQALDASNHELESFAYSVSHDLRAPLRAIDGYSHILQEDYGEKLDAEAQRLIHVVRDGVAKMARLIDDVLEFSRAARGAIGTSVIDMAGLVQATLQLLAPAMAGRSIAVQVAKLPPMRGDREMIGRVWMNLLDNAIKFTGHRDDALIEVGSYAETGEAEDTVYFVKDNGAGFDMAYVDKLFSVFQRLHGPEDFPGTGAGLAIVKRIVARHGGRAWAEGKIGDGAAFYFAVPPMEPQSGPQAKPEPAHV